MKNKTFTGIITTLAILALCIETYCLEIINLLTLSATGSCSNNIFTYLEKPTLAIPYLVTICIIIYGVLRILYEKPDEASMK